MAIQNSIRRMMEEGILMPGGGIFPSGPSVGGMSPEDRRDYVANVLRTKVRFDIRPVFRSYMCMIIQADLETFSANSV